MTTCMAPLPLGALLLLVPLGIAALVERQRRRKAGYCPWFGDVCEPGPGCPMWLRHCPGIESEGSDD